MGLLQDEDEKVDKYVPEGDNGVFRLPLVGGPSGFRVAGYPDKTYTDIGEALKAAERLYVAP